MQLSISIGFVIFGALAMVQLILATIAWWERRHSHLRMDFPLSSQTSVVDLLEKYSRIHGPLDVKVNVAIDRPASLDKHGTLLINRSHVYRTSSYPTFYTLYQIMLGREQQRELRLLRLATIFIFSLQIITCALAIWVLDVFIWASVIFALVALLLSIYWEHQHQQVLKQSVELAIDLLDLDEVEQIRMVGLAESFKGEGFKYIHYPVTTVIKFLLPRRY
jgi:hypothetical protein